MKKENLFFLLFLAILFSCSPMTNKLNYNDNHKPESKGDLRFYSKETQMMYNISNDENNLYITIKADDEQVQRSILMEGMEIYIDTCKKSKQEIGILYPLSVKIGMKPQSDKHLKVPPFSDTLQNTSERPDLKNQKQNFNKQQRMIQLIGFKSMESNILPLDNNKGILVKIDWDSSKTLVYNAIIPFKTFYKEKLFANDTNKIFTFSIMVNSVQMPSRTEGMEISPRGGQHQRPPMGQQGMQNGFGGGGDKPSMEEGGQRSERPLSIGQPTSQKSKHEMHFRLSYCK